MMDYNVITSGLKWASPLEHSSNSCMLIRAFAVRTDRTGVYTGTLGLRYTHIFDTIRFWSWNSRKIATHHYDLISPNHGCNDQP